MRLYGKLADEIETEYESIHEYVKFVKNLTSSQIEEYWKNANKSCVENLIVRNVEQIVKMLLESSRVKEYIKDSESLIFREWIDYSIEDEFRKNWSPYLNMIISYLCPTSHHSK